MLVTGQSHVGEMSMMYKLNVKASKVCGLRLKMLRVLTFVPTIPC